MTSTLKLAPAPIKQVPATRPAVAPELPAMRLVQSSRGARRAARLLVIVFFVVALGVVFLPWQQTASGTGQVTAFSPLDRPQAIPAPITGRIVNWFGHREGSRVRAGEVIVEIQDNDPEYLGRLQRSVAQARLKVDAAKAKVKEYDFQVTQLESYRDFTVAAGTGVLEASLQKVQAAQQGLAAARAELLAAEQNFNRKKPLADMGYESDRALDLAVRDLTKAKTDVARYEAELQSAKADVAAKEATRDSYQSDGEAKIAKARAEREDALSQLTTAERELLAAETTQQRQERQSVTSPVTGTILRLQAAAAGDQVSAGDPLFLVVPDAYRRAVEIWVDGNDATLIEPGRKVRLVFEGFPGVQFAGWPSVAVGTFGGIVDLVDATDNGLGSFRVLIVPDDADEPWPGDPYLRQGVKVNGFVLLNRVPLWFEIWRKLNGFPPTVEKTTSSSKPAKELKKRSK